MAIERRVKPNKDSIDNVIANNLDYSRKLILFEVGILRSITRHYQKLYNLNRADAEYVGVMQHAEYIREWYERKYLTPYQREIIHQRDDEDEH